MKTKHVHPLYFISILLLSLFSMSSCNFGTSHRDMVEHSTEVSAFNKIKLIGGYDVKLIQSDTVNVKISTAESMHKRVKVWVDDSTLYVQNKIKSVNDNEVELYISFPSITSLDVQGGVNLNTIGFLNLDDFKLSVEGGANINMKINANSIRSKAQGGVNIVLAGTTIRFETITEGAGNIDADRLEAKNVVCRMSGVGNSSVYATETLNATLEGVGKIGYRGKPEVTQKVDGLGLVYRK